MPIHIQLNMGKQFKKKNLNVIFNSVNSFTNIFDQCPYYICKSYGLKGIIRSDCVHLFQESPYSQILPYQILNHNTIKRGLTEIRVSIITLCLRYGSFKILDYLIENDNSLEDLIYNSDKLNILIDHQKKYLSPLLNLNPDECIFIDSYLKPLSDVKDSVIKGDYIYLDYEERKRFAESSFEELSKILNFDGSDGLESPNSCERITRVQKVLKRYNNFWVNWINHIDIDDLNCDSDHKNKTSKLVIFLLRHQLFEGLIKLNEVLEDSSYSHTWYNIKFRLVQNTKLMRSLLIPFLNLRSDIRDKIEKLYFSFPRFWRNIFQDLGPNIANQISFDDYIWLIELESVSIKPKKTLAELLIISSVDTYQLNEFKKAVKYLTDAELLSLSRINSLTESIFEKGQFDPVYQSEILNVLE